MRSHRATTRVSLAALAFTAVFALSQQGILRAGPQPEPAIPVSILPSNVGIGIATDDAVTITFDAPMNRASVEAALQILPAQDVALSWDDEGRALTISAERRWQTDQRYLLVLAAGAARGDGAELGAAQRFSFTTQTAPRVTDFQVAFSDGTSQETEALLERTEAEPVAGVVGFEAAKSSPPALAPSQTADGVSARTGITIGFSAAMDRADVEESFAITPEVNGTFSWEHQELTFVPDQPLEPDRRYTVSVVGAHDADGNLVAGKANFSFTTQVAAQVITITPATDATEVTDGTVEIWFSQPMDALATEAAFSLVDTAGETAMPGTFEWNTASTQVRFIPEAALAAGTTYEVRLAAAEDRDGNQLDYGSSFTTAPEAPPAPVETSIRTQPAPPPPPPAPVVAPPPPSGDLNAHALAQINASRAAYGFAPLVLDAGASAAAYAHAYDQAVNNYFSHTSLDGRSRDDRLRAAGVSFSYSGENQCYHAGIGIPATLEWCHSAFMAEPYPGHWNHIANILDPRFTRVGVGIAEMGGRVVITWNFVN